MQPFSRSSSGGYRLFPFVDRFAGVTTFGFAISVLLDALVLRRFQRTAYSRGTAAVAQLRDATEQLAAVLSAGPKIEPPIYFQYVDDSRTDSLYSQIAQLQLRERTVTRFRTLKAKAELNAVATVSLEKGRDDQSTDKLEAGELSVHLKCMEVMRYVLETRPKNCYANALDWCLRELGNELSEPLKSIGRLQTPSLGKLSEDAKSKMQRWQQLLENELQQVEGMVFVYGEFERSSMDAGQVIVRKFAEKPFKCFFRLMLPQNALESLPAGKLRKLTVFGTAVKPLGDDGFVDVTAVAVF